MSHDERMLSGNWQPEDGQFTQSAAKSPVWNTLVSPKLKTKSPSISRPPSKGKRPHHVLLYGPPGLGKTTMPRSSPMRWG